MKGFVEFHLNEDEVAQLAAGTPLGVVLGFQEIATVVEETPADNIDAPVESLIDVPVTPEAPVTTDTVAPDTTPVESVDTTPTDTTPVVDPSASNSTPTDAIASAPVATA